MTTEPQPWLPLDAITPERIRPGLERVIGEWSDCWFAQQRAVLKPALQDNGPIEPAGAGWRSAGGLASIELGPAAQAAIAGAMLGATVPPSWPQGPERGLIEHLAESAADDLLSRLAALAGGSGARGSSSEPLEPGGSRLWTLAVGPGKRPLRLALSNGALVAIAKHSLAAPAPRTPLALRQALAGQEVEVSASLGRCALSLTELKALAVGDVLVLDREAERPLGLRVDGAESPLRACLEPRDGKAALVLVQPF